MDAVAEFIRIVLYSSMPRRCGAEIVSKSRVYFGGGHIMRMAYVLSFLLAALSVPAAAADLKQEVEKIGSAYAESFNKQDAAAIAALYATGGVLVNQAGPHPDIAEFYQGLFKTGFNHNEITVDQAWPLGTDTALALGEYRISGKNQNGEPIEAAGRWTSVDVREGGNLKIRMLTAFPKPPQPPK
jgi:ketosteroid isomerase-like protein